MPHPRRRPTIAATGRITVRLSPRQRDVLMAAPQTPQGLGHALHRAAVRGGELSVRVTREELYGFIDAAAHAPAPDRRAERELDALVRYLESLADRFDEPNEEGEQPSP